MRHTRVGILGLAMCAIAAAPSHGQFYSLEGRYECLNDPKAVCYDASSNQSAPEPKLAPEPYAAPISAPPVRPAAKPVRARVASPNPIATDPLGEIATRLQGGTAAPNDIALLRGRAAAGDKRSTELLAWCHLRGVGVQKDPVPAYLLYGVAARLGVLNAERNQAIVYETDMSPEQRQQAVAIENWVMFGAAGQE